MISHGLKGLQTLMLRAVVKLRLHKAKYHKKIHTHIASKLETPSPQFRNERTTEEAIITEKDNSRSQNW